MSKFAKALERQARGFYLEGTANGYGAFRVRGIERLMIEV
jgi:hypothetical protein